MKHLIFSSIFFIFIYAQVAPDYKPYSIENPDVICNQETIHIKDVKHSFIQQAFVTIQPDFSIYRLSIEFDTMKSGYVFIDNWNVPDDAILFIFNNEESYTGPYLKNSTNEFISGRFISNKIILEYIVPNNVNFIGDFTISEVYSDSSIPKHSDSNTPIVNYFSNRERPKVMVTGYWPPTNEMVRHFSQDADLNPSGWKGENWEGLGYDVVSFFP